MRVTSFQSLAAIALTACLSINVYAADDDQPEPGFWDSVVAFFSGEEAPVKPEQPAQADMNKQAAQPAKPTMATAESAKTDNTDNVQPADLFGTAVNQLKSEAGKAALTMASEVAGKHIQASTAELKQKLETMIADKQCTSSAQCETVGVGHLPCGGPALYMVYSTQTVSGKAVQQVADLITEQEKKLQAKLGMAGICVATPRITAQCVNEQCIEVSSAPTAH